MAKLTTFSGRCHCGNLSVVLETRLSAEELPLRACGCSFCSQHGSRCTSDPEGGVRLHARDASLLSRYRFGLHTADFLVCRRCGVYVAALMSEDDRSWAIVNVNALDAADQFTQKPATMNYDAEDVAQRRGRRAARWTPVLELRVA